MTHRQVRFPNGHEPIMKDLTWLDYPDRREIEAFFHNCRTWRISVPIIGILEQHFDLHIGPYNNEPYGISLRR